MAKITHKKGSKGFQPSPKDEATPKQVEAPSEDTETPENEQTDSGEVSYEFDPDAMTVRFHLFDGTPVTLQEPTPYKFRQMESWVRTSQNPLAKDFYFMLVQLALICAVEYGEENQAPSFEDYMNRIDNYEDDDRLIGGLQFFRDQLERYTDERLSKLTANRGNI